MKRKILKLIKNTSVFFNLVINRKRETQSPTTTTDTSQIVEDKSISHRTMSYHRMFYLADNFGPCILDESQNKYNVIKQILPEDKYRVENIMYCDIHRQIIVNERLNLDIGMVPQELGITFYQYRDKPSEAIIKEIKDSEIKMQFIVYKE